MLGRSVAEYRAPLFLAWQLTNRCRARCLTCCEESGPELGWPDEMSHAQALAFQFMLDRLTALNMIAWVREPDAIHVTVATPAS